MFVQFLKEILPKHQYLDFMVDEQWGNINIQSHMWPLDVSFAPYQSSTIFTTCYYTKKTTFKAQSHA